MPRLPSIHSLMSPPAPKALQSPTNTPPSNSNRLPSYSPENTLAPISNVLAKNKTLAPFPKKHLTPELPTMLSPPTSPWTDTLDKKSGANDISTMQQGLAIDAKDPVLFPSDDARSGAMQTLFAAGPSKSAVEKVIQEHIATSMVRSTGTSPPTKQDYMLALECIPDVGRAYSKFPGAYLKRQREEEMDMYYMVKRICAEPGQRYVKPKAPVAVAQRPTKQPRKPVVHAALAALMDRPRRTPKPTPKASPEAENDQLPKKASALPKKATLYPKPTLKPNGIPRQQAKPVIRSTSFRSETPEAHALVAKRDDKDYNLLPDYSPPLSTLDNSPVALKTEWASPNPYNHANDPDRQLLHASEIKVAETLRLSCAQYLCSKRRIFEARLSALRVAKPFRKTDAQKACQIDVNKASKLFSAFEKVGWLEAFHFEKFL